MPDLRPYQQEFFDAVVETSKKHRRVIGRAPTGCHAKGQRILMWDGHAQNVEDINVGDYLIGPDSKPRIVQRLVRGRGKMYRITPVKGRPWVVNEDHILTLVQTRRKAGDETEGTIVDVSVKDWLAWSPYKKHIHKLFRVGVEWCNPEPPTIDPYFFGVILGDGTMKNQCSVTTMDAPIVYEIASQCAKYGLRLSEMKKEGNQASTYRLSGPRGKGAVNPIRELLKDLNADGVVCQWKRIHPLYLFGSRRDRLELLAGLIDTDGYYGGGCYDFISKSIDLASDVTFLSRSLGMAAYISACQKFCQTGGGGEYYRVQISGNLEDVPCRLRRKRATKRLQKKDVLRTGFSATPAGEDDYYGFTLDGDGRYLLEDFTVTHNCGKAVLLAALAHHYSQFGRVMLLVDVRKLVRQLADTIYWYTGIRPGIEMGDERAINDDTFCTPDRIVISTPQTQYSGPKGRERFRRNNVVEFSFLGLDECETYVNPVSRSREVVDWFYNGNPNLTVFGTTASPCRSDGLAMANLFDAVAFDRDIEWGRMEGWLVRPRQAFVRVSADFSTLSVKKSEDGEQDYSNEELASKIIVEQTQIELAKGILHVAQDRKSIIACPTVEVARAVAHYIDAEKPGSARCIYGELGDEEKDDIFASFNRNEFQFLSSVMMCTKGLDVPDIRAVFNCRKTKSKRLFIQIVGRGVRPLKGVVDGLDTAAERIAAIAASAKPDCIIGNMVGVESEVRDMTILDILGEIDDDAVLERAKQKMRDEDMDSDEAMEEAGKEVEAEREAERALGEVEAEHLEDLDEQRLIRSRVRVNAHVDVEFQDDLSGGGNFGIANSNGISDRQMSVFRQAKLTDREIASLTPESAKHLSQQIVSRWKKGLCSFAQARILRKAGYSKAELATLPRKDASAAIEAAKANGWRRPTPSQLVVS